MVKEDFNMAIYKCMVCGNIYDEEKEGKPVSELDSCPVCMVPATFLKPVEGESASEASASPAKPQKAEIAAGLRVTNPAGLKQLQAQAIRIAGGRLAIFKCRP